MWVPLDFMAGKRLKISSCFLELNIFSYNSHKVILFNRWLLSNVPLVYCHLLCGCGGSDAGMANECSLSLALVRISAGYMAGVVKTTSQCSAVIALTKWSLWETMFWKCLVSRAVAYSCIGCALNNSREHLSCGILWGQPWLWRIQSSPEVSGRASLPRRSDNYIVTWRLSRA